MVGAALARGASGATDRGPAALDWAVLRGDTHGGVTVLQATGEFDAGPCGVADIRCCAAMPSRAALYRQEVTRAAVEAVLEAVARGRPRQRPRPRHPRAAGGLVPKEARAIDWLHDDSATVLRKIRAAPTATPAWPMLFGHAAACTTRMPPAPRRSPVRRGEPGAIVVKRARRCCAARWTAACG